MKKTIFKTLFLALATTTLFAQANKESIAPKYRRSSLHTILMESESFPKKDIVLNSYYSAPFPDKYDNHNIGEKSFEPTQFTKTAAEQIDLKNTDNYPKVIENYFKEKKIANQLVAKWYNRQVDGSFNANLIAERGIFDASYLDVKTAKASSDGINLLKGAGEELLGNTFVVVSKMKFIENEPVARGIRDVVITAANNLSMELARKAAIKLAEKTYEKTKEGYSVWTTCYLYKLKWNAEILDTFYTQMYFEKDQIDAAKKNAFDNNTLFEMEYVGTENTSSLVTFSLTEKRTEDQIIQIAVSRNIENTYAKLQKKYDVFKPVVPLYTGNPITAKIGLKEGLEGGDKFEVLEPTLNLKTGLTEYKKIGTIKVDSDNIWDNRFNLTDDATSATPTTDRTTFKGGDKFASGMLIRQIK